MNGKILLIGPLPPPEHGTSLPFRAFVDYLRRHTGAEVVVVNSESGEKKNTRLVSMSVLRPFLVMTRQLLVKGRTCSQFVIYGSQRFVATAGALYTALIRLLWNRNVSIYVQGGAFDQFYAALSPLARGVVRNCLSQAKVIIVQTNLVLDALSAHFRNLAFVPNWISEVGNRDPGSGVRDPKPGTRNPKPDVIRFAFVGDVVWQKGILELAKAFASVRRRLSEQGIGVALDIYGPCRDNALDTIRETDEYDCTGISYHGPLAHSLISGRLARHDALVLPTWWPCEGYPAVVIEAMTLGLPVIATRFRAIPELVRDGKNGLLCEPRDPVSLADCLYRLAEDAGLRSRLGNAARATARRFSISVVGPELCRVCGINLRDRSAAVDTQCTFQGASCPNQGAA
jgi:glycosyltransferase involved in cell wall biosynthesis